MLRIIDDVDENGNLTIKIPKEFGKKVKVLILPASYEENETEIPEYFGFISEDGTEYKIPDWTDKEFNRVSMQKTWEGDDTEGEDILDE